MAETAVTAVELHNRRVEEQLEQALQKMEQGTAQQVSELRMTQPGRGAVQRSYRKVICGRSYWLVPRHSALERRFLRMMLELAIATDPSLQDRAVEVARYMSKNYPYEWLTSAVTYMARSGAQDLILRAADSSFGSTPLARELGFVLFHHRKLHITNVSDYTELYSRALSLDKTGLFHDEYPDWRLDLGLQRHPEMRRRAQRSS